MPSTPEDILSGRIFQFDREIGFEGQSEKDGYVHVIYLKELLSRRGWMSGGHDLELTLCVERRRRCSQGLPSMPNPAPGDIIRGKLLVVNGEVGLSGQSERVGEVLAQEFVELFGKRGWDTCCYDYSVTIRAVRK